MRSDESHGKVMYVCNLMTQPGETDDYKASDHVKVINNYLGNKKLSAIIVNSGIISKDILTKYSNLEQKDQVIYDKEELKKIPVDIIEDNLSIIEDGILRHNITKLGFHIFSYMIL